VTVIRWTLVAALTLRLFAQTAAQLFDEGRKAERQEQYTRAYLLYSQAAALDPNERKYWARSQLVRPKAIQEAKISDLVGFTRTTSIEDVGRPEPARLSPAELAEVEKLRPPPRLQPLAGRKNLDFTLPPRQLHEKVSQAFGLDVVFDYDYPSGGSPIAFRIQQADYREALRAVDAATGSLSIPVSERLLLVAKDNMKSRAELDPFVALAVPIPEPVSVPEAQELAKTVQQVMELAKFGVDTGKRIVIFRDRLSKAYPAQMLFMELLQPRGQVTVEVEFLELNENSALSYGLRLPTKTSLVSLAKLFGWAIPAAPAGYAAFGTFGGGRSLFGVGIADAELFASLTRNSAQTLMRAEIRSVDGAPASLHVGDRYPIVTAGYYGQIGSGGQAYTPPASFNFEDLGVVIKVTPRVHDAQEVTLVVESEFKVLTGEVLNSIPVISNRRLNSTVRLRSNEWAVIAGLVKASEARSLAGVFGLANLPLLGPLVRQNTREKDSRQVLLVLRPRIIQAPPSERVQTRSLWLGSEARPLNPL